MKQPRNRIVYALALVIVIVAGLASRSSLADALPLFVATYAGDTLWALMVFLGLGFLFPKLHTLIVAAMALTISFGVEFSQMYQAEWINSLRDTRVGALVLGAGFLASDFVCYATGIALGIFGEIPWRLGRRRYTPLSTFSDRWRIGK